MSVQSTARKTGKGSRDRVKNLAAFRRNYEAIFKAKNAGRMDTAMPVLSFDQYRSASSRLFRKHPSSDL